MQDQDRIVIEETEGIQRDNDDEEKAEEEGEYMQQSEDIYSLPFKFSASVMIYMHVSVPLSTAVLGTRTTAQVEIPYSSRHSNQFPVCVQNLTACLTESGGLPRI